MQKPEQLRTGSRIAVVAPSFAADPDTAGEAAESIREMGFIPVLFPSCHASFGYFAGSDRLRASDINRAFLDPSIDGIFCLRGGYGAARLLPLLDYHAIRTHPKVFMGYSDVTALHLVFQQRCRMVTFHGPVVRELKQADSFTRRSMLCCLCTPGPSTLSCDDRQPLQSLSVRPGRFSDGPFSPGASIFPAEGILTGGNLTTLCSLLGTPYEPDTRGKILFLEETNEASYRIDRMLTSLALSGKLEQCAGILLGSFTDCPSSTAGQDRAFSLEEVLRDRLCLPKLPVFFGLPCGHGKQNLTLPLGVRVRLCPADTSVHVTESCTRSDTSSTVRRTSFPDSGSDAQAPPSHQRKP